MSDIHISKLLEDKTQNEVAVIMGVTQGAVHQMVKNKRDVFFKPNELGGYEFYEIRKPSKKKAA